MVKIAKICDVCGREMSKYNATYTLTYKTIFFQMEKDICPLCFDRLKEQIRAEQTEPSTDCSWK